MDRFDSLEGQVALVTGATRGIGAEIAAHLVERGATVYAGARDTADVDAPDQRPIELDVTDDAEMAAAADRVADETGRLDVLVNNAGIFPRSGPLQETPTEVIDRTLVTNFRGPVVLTKEVLPSLLATDAPRVITISSGLGRYTQGNMGGGYPPYRLSKAGLGGLTAYLHAEYASEGLFAAAVDPGWVRTDMGGRNANRPVEEGAETPVWLAGVRDGPGGRIWRDREVVTW